MYIDFTVIMGILFTVITSIIQNPKEPVIGLSSYGGVLGVIISAWIFEKIMHTNNKLTKYAFLSLPLAYSIGKIGCFTAGCCSGIPYDGIFSITYVDKLNIPVFPIQLLETFTFFTIFALCDRYRNTKNIVYIETIICAVAKFLLDFLRYDHYISKKLTVNQIFSIFVIIITIIIYIVNKRKNNFMKESGVNDL
jgi:prolipoprotein diacylglyceryltransferase